MSELEHVMNQPTGDPWSGKTVDSGDATDAGNQTAEDVPITGSDDDSSDG